MKLTLVNSQTDEEFDVDAEIPVTIGRGPMFGCFDKRVSRNHGQLRLTSDGNLHVTALHSNPCFFMKDGLPPVHQFTKNEGRILSNGDYFGLLPDSFWYKIVITTTKSDENCDVGVNCPSILKNEISKTILTSETINEENENHVKNNKVVNGYKELCFESSAIETKAQSLETTESSLKKKDGTCSRSLSSNKWLASLDKTKKLPLWMYEIDDFPQPEGEKLKSKCSNGNPEVKGKKINISSSTSHVEGDVTSTEVSVEKSPQLVVKSENHTEISNQKAQTENREQCKKLNNIEYIETSGSESSEHVNKEKPVADCSNDRNNSNSDPQEASLSSQKRPLCQYEGNCYRKNVQHQMEFCHPGDQDFVPYENRPVCEYGTACYRRNKLHRVEFRHLPNDSTAKRKGTEGSISPRKKRPKKQVNYRRSSDEDDYDLQDPFIDDATSDEYIPSDLASNEEDVEETDFSEGSEADVAQKKQK